MREANPDSLSTMHSTTKVRISLSHSVQPHQKISVSRDMVFETVEIFMAVFIEEFANEFFEEHRHKDFNCPRKLVLAQRNILVRL